MTTSIDNYKSQLNSNLAFQKAFLTDLGRKEVKCVTVDDDGIEATIEIIDRLVEKIFKNDFSTTEGQDWSRSYEYDHETGLFMEKEDWLPVRLYDEYCELGKQLGEPDDYVNQKAAEALEFNAYGFPNSELKSKILVGKGDNVREEEIWDFDKFADVLVSHLTFRTWERLLTTGKVERDLFIYTSEDGYKPFGPNEMGTMLKQIGVQDSKTKSWYKELPILIMNHPKVPKFHEWNTKLIACKNGVLDPYTLELRPHSPDNLVKNRLLAEWNPNAQHPMADKVFNDIPDDDDRAMVKAMLAVTLAGNDRRNFFIQKGVTGTGKSTITELWGNCVLGPALRTTFYAQRVFGESENCKFGLVRFDTAFMAVCDDMTQQRIKDSGTFKTATSGGTISIEYKGKDSYDAPARAVIIINSNDVPNFEDRSGAILDRARFINRDWELDKDKRISFKQYESDEAFKSRLLYLVLEEFQNMKVQEEDGTISYRLPPESTGAKAMREVAQNKGAAIIMAFKRIMVQKRIIGMTMREISDALADTYKDINNIEYTAMGADVLNNALHSIGIGEKFRLQLYSYTQSESGKMGLISKKEGVAKQWNVYVSSVIAFSSTDANERDLWGKYAVRYREVIEGRAVTKCIEIAKKDYNYAAMQWAKFKEAYDFVIAKVAEFDPEAVELYEAKPVPDAMVPKELDFHAPDML